jgi:SAM-dependent methyltransferase
MKDVGYYFKQYLSQYINENSEILEIGCGHQSFGSEYYKIAKRRVGIDPDNQALIQNKIMNEKICCRIDNIPDSIDKFDVVIAQWVMEHLEDPKKDIKVISNLCKTGGHFIFMTTNIYSPLMLISKILPIKIKKIIRRVLLGVDEDDTYPTRYKLNSYSRIEKYLGDAGFRKVELHLIGAPSYFSWCTPLMKFNILFNKIIGNKLPFLTHIVGVYKKVV